MRTVTSSGPVAAVAVAGILALAIAPALSKPTAASTSASFTSAQATAGAEIYQSSCAMCHGTHLEGAAGPAIAGANANLRLKHFTVSDVFAIMTTQMPLNAPASLTHDQYVSLIAYVLMKNGAKSGAKLMTYAEAVKSKSTL
jgi:mono/diheme cytochrome c family protein